MPYSQGSKPSDHAINRGSMLIIPTQELLMAENISYIIDNLYVGAYPDAEELKSGFKYVFNLTEYQYHLPHEATGNLFFLPMHDVEELPDMSHAWMVARTVTEARKLGKTLVHCIAGQNRSGFISSLSLVHTGFSGESAIKLLRRRRFPEMLNNRAFFDYVNLLKPFTSR